MYEGLLLGCLSANCMCSGAILDTGFKSSLLSAMERFPIPTYQVGHPQSLSPDVASNMPVGWVVVATFLIILTIRFMSINPAAVFQD